MNAQKFNEILPIYDNLLDIIPSLLGYVETVKKSCTIIDECTIENEHTEIE